MVNTENYMLSVYAKNIDNFQNYKCIIITITVSSFNTTTILKVDT